MTRTTSAINQIFSTKTIIKFGCWNARTLSQDGKLHIALKEMENYKMDILGISEMRWIGKGQSTEEQSTILYSGHDTTHTHGVGIILKGEARKALTSWDPVSDRIITARLLGKHSKISFIQVYAPTEAADEEEKDAFYGELQDVIDAIPSFDLKILMGDLNAQIGPQRMMLESTLGPHGTAERHNNNGSRLISFCSANGLRIGNTFYAHKNIHKKTWRSPDGRTMNEIDWICISSRWRSSLRDVCVRRGADIGSDHYLLMGSIRIKLKKTKQTSKEKPYATAELKNEEQARKYKIELRNRFECLSETANIEDSWKDIKKSVTDAAENSIGRRRGNRREQWISRDTWNVIDRRKEIRMQRDQAEGNHKEQLTQEHTLIDRDVKKRCKKDKKKWYEAKEQEAEEAARRNDAKTLYKIVKELTGTDSINKTIPVKDKAGNALKTEEEQNARWAEHFKEVLNQPEPPALIDFTGIANQDTLDVDLGEITEEEITRAIKSLKNGKSPGEDMIAPEMMKHGGQLITDQFRKLFNLIWTQEAVPNDWQKGSLVKLPKKGDLGNCNNWRGITLLSIPGKVFCSTMLNRIKTALDVKLREEQAGFRSGRSCSEQIFILRNIIEQCNEYNIKNYINFVDFKKAFDSVHRETVWKIMAHYGIPQKVINITKKLYEHSSCRVRTNSGHTEYFDIVTGVRQGCILSPTLFLLTIDFVMRRATNRDDFGIEWGNGRLTDLDFADDLAMLSTSGTTLQDMTDNLSNIASNVGLRISSEKTKVMAVKDDQLLYISINQQQTEQVNNFTYLGSQITSNGDTNPDIHARLGKARSIFRRSSSTWTSNHISLKTKCKLFKSLVISVATYACETWKVTEGQAHTIDTFQQQCLRRITKTSWRDHITNRAILQRTDSEQLSVTLEKRRLKLLGHVVRMPRHRHASTALDWTPPGGRRRRGRPVNTWRRTLTKDLERRGLTWERARTLALDRENWRSFAAAQCPPQGRRN